MKRQDYLILRKDFLKLGSQDRMFEDYKYRLENECSDWEADYKELSGLY